jgi:uncharacterized protein YndB with AHSA1/START domain
MNTLTLTTHLDTQLIATRRFAAPPEAVYRAHTEPALIQQWLLGPDGWTMPVCLVDVRPGGSIRYEWTNGQGAGFSLTGEYVTLEPPSRIVHIERMHLPDATPDTRVETTFVADGTGTMMTMTLTLPNAHARQAMMASGMERGMEASYRRLEQVMS